MASVTSPRGPRDEVIVRSPEGVELSLPIAGPAPRMAAYALDGVLVVVVMIGLFFLLTLALPAATWFGDWLHKLGERMGRGDRDDAFLALVPLLLLLLVLVYFSELLYFGLWELATRGRTPGKYLVGLRVVGMEGQPLDAKAAMIRNLLRAVDTLPGGYAVGLIAVVTSQYGQRLGDHAAGTLVIRTDKVERAPELALPSELEPLALSREQLAKLGATELALVRGTLRRIETAGPDRRDELVRDAAKALTTRLALDPELEPNPTRLLQRVLLAVERRAR
jgi:uncharacterized RDD family membrane protein YckC